jgi:hypothetical protein
MQRDDISLGNVIRDEGRKGDAKEWRREGRVGNEQESANQLKAWHPETT